MNCDCTPAVKGVGEGWGRGGVGGTWGRPVGVNTPDEAGGRR